MEPKVILITGTSSGIGYITALHLASLGHNVYASMRNLQKKDKLLNDSIKRDLNINICELDVTNITSVQNCISQIVSNEKKIDVLINNAGFAVVGEFSKSANKDFEEQFATNFFGALNCTREVLPKMLEQQYGQIINISSILGLMGLKETSMYCSSKFALEGWSESVRYELKKDNIWITLVEPGFFDTEILNNVKSVEDKPISGMNINANPLVVAKKIAKIIKKKKPKLRYTVGYDSLAGNIAKKIVPATFFEAVVGKYC